MAVFQGINYTYKLIKKSLVYIGQYSYICTTLIGSGLSDFVAQLVEHNTFNVGVLGSNPSEITRTASLSN
jgi:hypothetical protein